jgi:hypothetical protein
MPSFPRKREPRGDGLNVAVFGEARFDVVIPAKAGIQA